MRKDYPKIGTPFTSTDEQRAALDDAIERMKWQPVKGLRLGFAPGAAIKAAIREFKIPKVSHVAVGCGDSIRRVDQSTEEWHPAIYGIEGHYTNGTAQIFLLDTGAECVPIGIRHYQPGEEQPFHRAPVVEAPAGDSVTIYAPCEMFGGMTKIEAKACVVEFRSYAQHPRASYVTFVPRGKRKEREIVFYEHRKGLIVGGWGRPDPPSTMVDEPATPGDESGMVVSRSRYLSHDPRYQADFDAIIDPLIASGEIPVVYDFRAAIPAPALEVRR